MNWLVLSFFFSLGTLSYQGQIFNPAGSAMFFTMPIPSFQTTFGVEAQLLDNHLFIGGSAETWESPTGSIYFAPSEAFYSFSAGLRLSGFEIGYRHECDHPIVNSWSDSVLNGYGANRDEFYLSYRGSIKIF